MWVFVDFDDNIKSLSRSLVEDYEKKIKRLAPFKRMTLPSYRAARDQYQKKKDQESKTLLNSVAPQTYLVLFDECGMKLPTEKLAKKWSSHLEKKEVWFAIGGPFGLSDEVKARANEIICLSDLTFSFEIAKLVALEQIYRCLTIRQNLPYHNQ